MGFPKLTLAFGLPVQETRRLGIQLGDGYKVFTQGMCAGLPIQLGHLTVNIDAFVLEFGGIDVVLGVSWLRTLGR